MDEKINCFRIEAKIEKLPEVMEWVRKHARLVGFSDAEIRKIELAIEEAVVNVIQYAYAEEEGDIELICDVCPNEKIQFTIKDKGPPFNPLLQTHKIDVDLTIEHKEEGGMGILVIKKYMDHVHYERQHPYNILTLVKNRRKS